MPKIVVSHMGIKIGNVEPLLHSGKFRGVIVTKTLEIVESFGEQNLQRVQQVARKMPNGKIMVLIGNLTDSMPSVVNYFGVGVGIGGGGEADSTYWCYVGIKVDGHMESLRSCVGDENVSLEISDFRLPSERGLFKLKPLPAVLIADPEPEFFDQTFVISHHNEPAKLLKLRANLSAIGVDSETLILQSSENVTSAYLKILDLADSRNLQSILIVSSFVCHDFVKRVKSIMKTYGEWNMLFLENGTRTLISASDAVCSVDLIREADLRTGVIAINRSIYSGLRTFLQTTAEPSLWRFARSTLGCYYPKISLGVRDGPQLPLMTVIVYLHNNEKTAPTSIYSIYQQDYPADRIKVHVVDNGSTDGSVRAIRKIIRKYPVMEFTYMTNMIDRDLSIGAAIPSTGPYCIIDADCYLPYSYISRGLLAESSSGCIIPYVSLVQNELEDGLLSKLQIKEVPFLPTAEPAQLIEENYSLILDKSLSFATREHADLFVLYRES